MYTIQSSCSQLPGRIVDCIASGYNCWRQAVIRLSQESLQQLKSHFASPAANKVTDYRCCSDDWLSRDGVPAVLQQSVFASNGSTLPSW